MRIQKFIPILDWLPKYKKSYLSGDLAAGLTVGVMLIPQGMAYAMIAGLPPEYGLYASILPQLVYAIFGTSRQLAVGPVAMDSLLVAAGIGTMATAGTEAYIILAILLAFLMGAIQFSLGVLRLGFLVNFLSKPVISAFTSTAAIIIGLNHLKYFIGVDIERTNNIFKILYEAGRNISNYNWVSVGIGVAGILIIKNIKKIHKAIPAALVAVIFGICLVYFGGLVQYDVKIIGKVSTGLPKFNVPTFEWATVVEMFPIALTLALIAFMEAVTVAKSLQMNHKGEYKIDANQELVGLGMANMVGSLFGSYPTTGGFSRSAVNDNAGAKTNLAAIISSALVLMTLLFLTPLFYYLPTAILASIIIVAVFGLIDWKYPMFLWRTNKEDFLMFLATSIVTFAFGILPGIGVGVVLSLILMIKRTTSPHVAELGRLPNSKDFRNIKRFDDIETREDTLVLRYDSAICFANTNHFVESVESKVTSRGEHLKHLVFHFGSISHIDSTALQALQDLISDLEKKGVHTSFSGVIGPVRDFLFRAGFTAGIGEDRFFLDVQSALDYFDHNDNAPSPTDFKRALQNDLFKESKI